MFKIHAEEVVPKKAHSKKAGSMELDDFIAVLDKISAANTIPEVVVLLGEIDSLPNVSSKDLTVIDECLTESVEAAILNDRFEGYFIQRYGNIDAAASASVFTDATPETIIVNGIPTEVYKGR